MFPRYQLGTIREPNIDFPCRTLTAIARRPSGVAIASRMACSITSMWRAVAHTGGALEPRLCTISPKAIGLVT